MTRCWNSSWPDSEGAVTPSGNVFEEINSEYYQPTSTEKRVADYAVIHQQKAQFMSISELVEEVSVAEATVSCLCKRLGYKGYSTFKLTITSSTAQQVEAPTVPKGIRPEDSIEELYQRLCAADRGAVAQTVELIRPDSVRKAADLFLSAEKALCMGQRESMILAQECARLFGTARSNFYAVLGSRTQVIVASHLTVRGVVLYFSYSGSTEELLKNLRIIRDRRAVAILVTRFPGSPGAAYADVALQCGSLGGPLQGGSVAARATQLYLVDVLSHEVCRRDVQGSVETREAMAEVLSDKHT